MGNGPPELSRVESSRGAPRLQHLRAIPDGEDIYDRCLTQAEIQGNINKANGERGVPAGGASGCCPGAPGEPGWGGGRPDRSWVLTAGRVHVPEEKSVGFGHAGGLSRSSLRSRRCDLASLLVQGALEDVDDALERQDALALYRALQDPVLALRHLRRDNLDRYLEQLGADRQQKALVGGAGTP